MTIAETIDEFLAELQKDTERRAKMKYHWRTACENAISETDPAQRPALIAFAETIMYARQNSLVGDPIPFEERKAFTDSNSEVTEQIKRCLSHSPRWSVYGNDCP